MGLLQTFREQLLELSPRWLRAYWSERFVGLVLGYTQDAAQEALGFALRIGWVKEETVTVDALPHLGRNFGLQRLPIETPGQFKTRLGSAWITWQFAGDESVLESQLATLGYPGVIYDPVEYGDTSYWSRFWIWFDIGNHPAIGPGPTWGSFSWGELNYGPIGLTLPWIQSIQQVIATFKPADWICAGINLQLSGWAYGTGHTWGETGLVWGGETAVIGAR